MIEQVDSLLRTLLVQEVPMLTTSEQVLFWPPNETFGRHVSHIGSGLFVNVFLADLRENVDLRSNERIQVGVPGGVTFHDAPYRMECHYLISAWNSAQNTIQIEATVAEHQLLGSVAAALLAHDPLRPASLLGDPPPAPWNEIPEVPMKILPMGGFPQLAEFWSTVQGTGVWRPCVHLVVTIPTGPTLRANVEHLVTTRILEFGKVGSTGGGEVWIQIAGTIRAPGGSAIADAEVMLDNTATGASYHTTTRPNGHFDFPKLRPGPHHIRVRASTFSPLARDIFVPSMSGTYDFTLQP